VPSDLKLTAEEIGELEKGIKSLPGTEWFVRGPLTEEEACRAGGEPASLVYVDPADYEGDEPPGGERFVIDDLDDKDMETLAALRNHAPALIAAAKRDSVQQLINAKRDATDERLLKAMQGYADALADRVEAAEGRVTRLETALHELMPRYIELYEAAGLGDPAESVGVEIARTALAQPPEEPRP